MLLEKIVPHALNGKHDVQQPEAIIATDVLQEFAARRSRTIWTMKKTLKISLSSVHGEAYLQTKNVDTFAPDAFEVQIGEAPIELDMSGAADWRVMNCGVHFRLSTLEQLEMQIPHHSMLKNVPIEPFFYGLGKMFDRLTCGEPFHGHTTWVQIHGRPTDPDMLPETIEIELLGYTHILTDQDGRQFIRAY